jgi:hypothetical protein
VTDDVALIREAARLMRQRAEAATKDWRVDVVGPLGAAEVLRQNVAVTNLWQDAAHAAYLSPGVLLLVADLLDVAANEAATLLHPRRSPLVAVGLAAACAYLGKESP